MKDSQQTQVQEENRDWRDDFLEELGKDDVIAVESSGILTKKDIETAMRVINESEQNVDETEEWELIKKLQREKVNRLFGGAAN